jgi:hypothetical protein
VRLLLLPPLLLTMLMLMTAAKLPLLLLALLSLMTRERLPPAVL